MVENTTFTITQITKKPSQFQGIEKSMSGWLKRSSKVLHRKIKEGYSDKYLFNLGYDEEKMDMISSPAEDG